MQYMLLIYFKETDPAAMDRAEMAKVHQEYTAFTEGLKQRGQFIANHGLKPPSTATTVKVREGKTITTDGPFAETREQLAGYYLVEAGDLDEAIGLAESIPGARMGAVEIRPVWG
ncbi:MAG TPA: YciI family protein [Gammaproteobacteria bacterium]|jgi:hypothetical protein